MVIYSIFPIRSPSKPLGTVRNGTSSTSETIFRADGTLGSLGDSIRLVGPGLINDMEVKSCAVVLK
jgi:hypothetical protein